ncbi:YigZ family protein [Paucilactobacillus suebicus]|uniref:YigZ family protein n=1 Tax=Paucilactobacillus suebicus DSM 5007 = KCTC 3549 TaxID=1423807 RepID=A0A0R1W7D0_9LACO|nr:YigZ family protein [Paucilactobacillus suebicus]KRM13607.1 hypothetical protein FD16_GL000178 [Paucilactobacillus suebicus DSM 5007 = KCTC 3549]
MSNSYLTIADNHTYEQIIKKSKFICSLARIHSEEDAKSFIEKVASNNPKANHNCFAYMLGDHDEIQRESDNGEPSGTAGVPILQALQHIGIHDVVAVVTRYFGGIKLGAGGLIRAYSGSTSNAIHEIGLIERVLQDTLQVEVSYSLHDQLLYFLQQQNISVGDQQYGVNVNITIFVNHEKLSEVINDLTNQFHDQLNIKVKTPRYNEIAYDIKKAEER